MNEISKKQLALAVAGVMSAAALGSAQAGEGYGGPRASKAQGTYVSGEAVSLLPVKGAYRRAMFMPPNTGANASFLGTARRADSALDPNLPNPDTPASRIASFWMDCWGDARLMQSWTTSHPP